MKRYRQINIDSRVSICDTRQILQWDKAPPTNDVQIADDKFQVVFLVSKSYLNIIKGTRDSIDQGEDHLSIDLLKILMKMSSKANITSGV